jgi:Prohead core protein serine protease
MKLIVDSPTEDIFGSLDVKTEGLVRESSGSISSIASVEFAGPYMVYNVKNRNGRRYKLEEGVSEVNRYQRMIRDGRSVGELEHPESATINLERACHKTTSLVIKENIAHGRSKVLTSTPCGRIVAGLMADGVKLGVSSRGLGELDESSDTPTVYNYMYLGNDVVHDPSAPGTYVENVLANKSYVVSDGGVVTESAYSAFHKSLHTLPVKKSRQDEILAESLMTLFKTLRNGPQTRK